MSIKILRMRPVRPLPSINGWIGGCRRELLDQTLSWNQRHLLQILRKYETHHNEHRPHRSLQNAAPLKLLPAPVHELDAVRVLRRDRIGGPIHEYPHAACRGLDSQHPQATIHCNGFPKPPRFVTWRKKGAITYLPKPPRL